jgi:CMP/dCMP kinase
MTSGDFLADRIAGRNVLVAIDGPAGSGKSSVAQAVAERLGFAKLDTGATYRAVALAALGEGVDLGDGAALATIAGGIDLVASGVFYRGKRIPEDTLRTPEVSAAASRVSAHPELREVLVERQRTAAREAQAAGGAVVEGRDIGIIVLPDAELKVFLSAAPEERARRRALQTGREQELERIRKAMHTRDQRDSERKASPLKPAPDAVVLDTTGLPLEEVVARVVELVREVREAQENADFRGLQEDV